MQGYKPYEGYKHHSSQVSHNNYNSELGMAVVIYVAAAIMLIIVIRQNYKQFRGSVSKIISICRFMSSPINKWLSRRAHWHM